MLHKYALLGHCGAVRKYLFLAQGDFIEVFLDLVNTELKKDAKREVFRHNIRSIVDQAIRLSNAQYHRPEFLDRLDVTLAVASLGEIGWDIFSFDYAITTPLHVVLSAKAMAICRQVSVFLWKLRRANYSLKECWNMQVLISHASVRANNRNARNLMRHEDTYDGARNSFDFCMIMVSNLSNKAHILRSIMGHITTNIQSYVMYEVLET